MDLRALRYFVATVEQGSITAAAESCFIAQPSITAAIQKLESEFGTQLLERSKKGVRPTGRGEDLYRMALSLLQHADLIHYRMQRNDAHQPVKISVAASICYDYLDQVLQSIRQHLPQSTMKIQRGASTVDETDVFITMDHTVPENWTFFPLWRDEYCLILPRDHDLAYRETLHIEDFHNAPLVERQFCEVRSELSRLLQQFPIDFNVVASVDNEEWALQLVASGVGIAFIPIGTRMRQSYDCLVRPLADIAGFDRRYRVAGVALNPERVNHPELERLAEVFADLSLYVQQEEVR